MTITVPLTREEEAKLISLAEERGMSPDAFVKNVVKDIIEKGLLVSHNETPSADREKQLDELFSAFDDANPASAIAEEAYHRDNWYR
jgi:hypothetical protein